MYHAIIGTERKQTQELHLHHNRFVEMFSAQMHLICGKRKKWLAFKFSMCLEIFFHRLLAHLTCMISYSGE